MATDFQVKKPAALRASLLAWFDGAARPLPWRTAPSPYRTWISEIMAQQTRMEVVVGYFERFVQRIPDLETLAAVPLDDVLALWSGLGYYSRARNLHRTARVLVSEYGGRWPEEPEELAKLPGIGRYTAAAIASIAFGRLVPVLDGNVSRVLARLLDLESDVRESQTVEALWQVAGTLVPAERPGSFNEALMELGALICTPGTPDCERCPIAGHCRAQASGTAALRPLRSRRRPPRLLPLLAAGLALPDGRLLLVQSPIRGLFGGLWSFPMLPRGRETERRLQKQLGIEIRLQEKLAELDHFLTHKHLSVWLFRGALSGPELSLSEYQGHCFVAPGAAPTDLGLSSLARKLWRIATDT